MPVPCRSLCPPASPCAPQLLSESQGHLAHLVTSVSDILDALQRDRGLSRPRVKADLQRAPSRGARPRGCANGEWGGGHLPQVTRVPRPGEQGEPGPHCAPVLCHCPTALMDRGTLWPGMEDFLWLSGWSTAPPALSAHLPEKKSEAQRESEPARGLWGGRTSQRAVLVGRGGGDMGLGRGHSDGPSPWQALGRGTAWTSS